jgi:hypothetical protein
MITHSSFVVFFSSNTVMHVVSKISEVKFSTKNNAVSIATGFVTSADAGYSCYRNRQAGIA